MENSEAQKGIIELDQHGRVTGLDPALLDEVTGGETAPPKPGSNVYCPSNGGCPCMPAPAPGPAPAPAPPPEPPKNTNDS